MKRRLIVGAVALAVAGGVFAAAASLNVSTQSLGAGSDFVNSCDADGISTDLLTGAGNLLEVTNFEHRIPYVILNDVDPSCLGATADVALTDVSGEPIAYGSAEIDGAVVEVEMGSGQHAPAASVRGISVVVHD